jgi:hypothetical protein
MADHHPVGGVSPTVTVTAHCPRCDRSEEIEGELEARAWLNGHLQAEHADELPDFEGTA